jgi:pyruvate/2-oxoglutarate dehydrogenase complex dihydrolipoamide acyltransferase (E2) component
MPFTETRMLGVRKMISEAMMKSLQSTAQYSTSIEIDASRLVDFRNAIGPGFQERLGMKLTVTPILVDVVAKVLQEYRLVNSIVEGDVVRTFDEVSIAVAVDTKAGLMVPVLKDVGAKSLAQITVGVEDLAARARSGSLTFDDVTGGTFTITNVGMYGVTTFTPILNVPQVAILGVGTIAKQPVFKDNSIQVCDILHVSLTADHRVVDGALSARFLKRFKDLLEDETTFASIRAKEV